MRISYKYTKVYSGAEQECIEGDVFKIIIPLSVGYMTKVDRELHQQLVVKSGGQVKYFFLEISNSIPQMTGFVV